jgi:antitoxin HicB
MNKLSLSYPAKIEKDEDEFLVTFRDLPNVFANGESKQEAIFNAQEVLDLLLEEMHKDKLDIAIPSKNKKGEIMVPVSPEIAAPIMLRRLRLIHNYTFEDVARIMNVKYQTYQQIESGKNITLKSLRKAAMAFGATVELGFLTN